MLARWRNRLCLMAATACALGSGWLAGCDRAEADITVRATGMQWKWAYDYLQGEGAGRSFFSDPHRGTGTPLVVPVGKKIRLLLGAVDVIHEWYVPTLGVEQTAVPTLVRETSFRAERTGVYRGECTPACGPDHLCLPIVVAVVSAEDYRRWVAAGAAAPK